MRIPWTNWKDRRLCLAVFAKETIGPPAVPTRTRWAPCRRSWPSSWVFPPGTRRSLLALVPAKLLNFLKNLMFFFISSHDVNSLCLLSFLTSWTGACTACAEQDGQVRAPEPEGWRHEKGRVHAAEPQRWVYVESTLFIIIIIIKNDRTAATLNLTNKPYLTLTADDNATIRVTNLSEDTRETDLQELFRPFGSISRIYLAKDKNTGQSKVSARLLFTLLRAAWMNKKERERETKRRSVIKAGVFNRCGWYILTTPDINNKLYWLFFLYFFCRASPLSASTVGRMQPEPSQECQDLDMIILFSMLNGPSKFTHTSF